MKKVLIITHSTDFIYGAAKSLEMLIDNVEWNMDFIFSKSYLHPFTEKEIARYTHDKCNNTQSIFLKMNIDCAYDKQYKKKIPIKNKLKQKIKDSFSYFDEIKLNKIIKRNKYNFILLNSMILFEYINVNNNYILYIREMFVGDKNTYNKLINKMRLAEKIIFIDPLLLKPFKEDLYTLKSYKCINNPFDMRDINNQTVDNVYEKLNIKKEELKNKIIVSCIGMIMPEKGVDFIIDAFIRVDRKDIKLLIVGRGRNDYLSYCKEIANNNVIFINETKEILNVYRISDYIIRGDRYFVTGRTVYEGLYSGCNIIVQGNKAKAEEEMFEFDKFKENIIFYEPRNTQSLEEVFFSIKKNYCINKIGNSNIKEYISNIESYIN